MDEEEMLAGNDYIYSLHGRIYAMEDLDEVRFIQMDHLEWTDYLTDFAHSDVFNVFRLPENLLRPQEDSDGMGTTEEGG